jgi:hypothetical protein
MDYDKFEAEYEIIPAIHFFQEGIDVSTK